MTYWLSISDDTMKLDDIGVGELPHDGCLLEELDLVLFTSSFLECLHSHIDLSLCSRNCPFTLMDLPKLT